jgi:hypothetical protein
MERGEEEEGEGEGKEEEVRGKRQEEGRPRKKVFTFVVKGHWG